MQITCSFDYNSFDYKFYGMSWMASLEIENYESSDKPNYLKNFKYIT